MNFCIYGIKIFRQHLVLISLYSLRILRNTNNNSKTIQTIIPNWQVLFELIFDWPFRNNQNIHKQHQTLMHWMFKLFCAYLYLFKLANICTVWVGVNKLKIIKMKTEKKRKSISSRLCYLLHQQGTIGGFIN